MDGHPCPALSGQSRIFFFLANGDVLLVSGEVDDVVVDVTKRESVEGGMNGTNPDAADLGDRLMFSNTSRDTLLMISNFKERSKEITIAPS